MSPDGKWVWNGQAWVPVAQHESVFPAYSQATAAAADAPVSPMVNTPASPFGPPPASAAPAIMSPPIVQPGYGAQGQVPPWQSKGGGRRTNAMYIGAGLVAVLIGVILIVSIGTYVLPLLRGNNIPEPTPTPHATPTPELALRSPAAVADRYIKYEFTPAVSNLSQPILDQYQACGGQLSFSCQNALKATDQQLTKSLSALSTGQPPPPCIAAQVAKLQADVNAMAAGVKQGLKGFADNNKTELVQGLTTLGRANKIFPGDIQAMMKAQTTACNAQPQGP